MYILTLELVKRCNLSCSYCYQTHMSADMTLEMGKRAIDFGFTRMSELEKDGIMISYFGGEPLLKFELIKELTEYGELRAITEGCKIKFEMTTNGLLFTQEVAEFCVEHNLLIKLSLDGQRLDHDLNRTTLSGNGSYQNIMNNMDSFKYYALNQKRAAQISMIINHNNYHNIYENFTHILELGFRSIDSEFNYCYDWQEDELAVIEDQLLKIAVLYIERGKAGKPFGWPLFTKTMLPYVIQRRHFFCGAGNSKHLISTDGSIYPCANATKDELRIGHIDQGFFEDRINQYISYNRILKGDCLDCHLVKNCQLPDCLVLNFETTGDFFRVSSTMCKLGKIKGRITQWIGNELDALQIGDYRKVLKKIVNNK